MIHLPMSLNFSLPGGQPIHLNLFKTALIVLFASLGLWVLASRDGSTRLLRMRDRLDGLSPREHGILAWSLGGLFAAFLIQLRVRQYYELQTMWDMAVETNVAWHMVHGPWFFNSFDNRLHLGQHFSPIFILIGLIYRVAEHPLTLLVIQSLALGVGLVAVYRLALLLCVRGSWAVVASILYVVNPYLHHANAHDFHRSPLVGPAILWLLVFVEEGRRVPAMFLAAVALSVEESIPLPLAGLGAYLMAFRPGWRTFGAGLGFISLLYFLLVTKVLLPLLSPEQDLFFWDRYANLGANFNEALLNLLLHPVWALTEALFRHHQVLYLFYFLVPVAFLPLLAWREACLLIIPLLTMLLSQNDGQYKLGFHYTAPALPFLFYGTVTGLSRLEGWFRGRSGVADRQWMVAFAGLFFLTALNSYRCPGYDLGFTDAAYAEAAFDLAARIPPSASVATDVRFAPLVANRHQICKIGREPGTLCDWTPVGVAVRRSKQGSSSADPSWAPEYVLIGAEPSPKRVQEAQRAQAYGEWLVGERGYQVMESRAGVTLLARMMHDG